VRREVGADVDAGFRTDTAASWFARLDALGVPCELSDPDFVLSVFDDPELRERGWVTTYEHPVVGRMDAQGILVDLSATPGRVQGPPLVPGQHTREVLAWLGYDGDRIRALEGAGAVRTAGPSDPPA
jgi:crotonobetainyl-CoA:carnitine CoA-transferase CaiB-like acyl-CoA transferase